jgi:hypothetical protein
MITNIQFYHGDYEELPPTLSNSVIIFPNVVDNTKAYVQNWWLKWHIFENETWEQAQNNGELKEDLDEGGIKTIFWSRDLLTVNGQKELLEEVERLLQIFNN